MTPQTCGEILLLHPRIFGDLLLTKTTKEFIACKTSGLKADKTKKILMSVALPIPNVRVTQIFILQTTSARRLSLSPAAKRTLKSAGGRTLQQSFPRVRTAEPAGASVPFLCWFWHGAIRPLPCSHSTLSPHPPTSVCYPNIPYSSPYAAVALTVNNTNQQIHKSGGIKLESKLIVVTIKHWGFLFD